MRVSDYVTMGVQNIHLMNKSTATLQKINERLSTGKKINSAADNPSMMIRMSRLESSVREQGVVQSNIQDGISLIETADSHLSAMHDVAQKLRELSVTYENDTLSNEDKKLIENEAKELLKSMKEIADSASYNSKPLFKGDHTIFSIFAGEQGTTKIEMPSIPSTPQSDRQNKQQNHFDLDAKSQSSEMNKETINKKEHSRIHEISSMATANINENAVYVKEDERVNESATFSKNQEVSSDVNPSLTRSSRGIIDDILKLPGKILEGIFGGHHSSNNGSEKPPVTEGEENNKPINPSNPNDNNNGNGDVDNGTGKPNPPVSEGEGNENPIEPENPDNNNNGDGGVDNGTTTPNPPVSNEGESNVHDESKIQSLLNPDVIDKYLLNPIATSRSALGIKQNSLEHQLDLSQNKETIYTKDLSRIEDADMAKEKMAQLTQQMLVEQNLQLFKQVSYDHRQYISTLLS